MIAFIIASGRGAAVALIVAFAFYFIAQRNFSKKIKTFLVLLLFCGILYWLLNALGSTLLDRFSNINYSSDNYGDQDIRILMWRQGLRQFISHPLFGSGIQLIGYSGYPHNIFVEILYTTGILGFIPFVVLIYNSFRAAFSIFRHYSSYSWIGILFIIGFMEHIFSGAVYTGGWLWFSIALLFAVQTNLQNQMFFKRKSLRRFY
jgi:O-antigen ligase